MRKNLDISPDAVRALTIEAAKNNTVFKLFAEKIIEDAAQPLIKKDKKVK